MSNQLVSITEVSESKERPSSTFCRSDIDLKTNNRKQSKTKTRQTQNNDKWTVLQDLKDLFESGFITKTEFKERTGQIIDKMTGTNDGMNNSRKDPSNNNCKIIPAEPPNFDELPIQNATKYVFKSELNTEKEWITSAIKVKIDSYPFAKGGLRYVYHMLEIEECTSPSSVKKQGRKIEERNIDGDLEKDHSSCVCKIAIDRDENNSTYFKDVEMQELCSFYAKKFNEYKPPREVKFPKAWIIGLQKGNQEQIYHVEEYLKGSYKKHNNNYGYVNEDYRNTPQAFSHFTYEASGRQLVVVDIQGVQDIYTDPQVHSVYENNFGKGNLGKFGIEKFIQTHRCNPICKYLKLTPINPFVYDTGTIPASQFMREAHIEIMKVENLHVYDNDPIVQHLIPNSNSNTSDSYCLSCLKSSCSIL